eukprot:11186627-Lingulodinium_polyedra.AAC.1
MLAMFALLQSNSHPSGSYHQHDCLALVVACLFSVCPSATPTAAQQQQQRQQQQQQRQQQQRSRSNHNRNNNNGEAQHT